MEKYFKIEWPDRQGEYWLSEMALIMCLLSCRKDTDEFKVTEIQPHCGHPVSAIVGSDEGTNYCRMCEEEAHAEGLVTVREIKEMARKSIILSEERRQRELQEDRERYGAYEDADRAERGLVCPVCKHPVEDTDYWDDSPGRA